MYIRLSWQYVFVFIALMLVCGGIHESTHHLVGFAVCGEWGRQTFGSFELARSCELNPYRFWATAAGPMFTFTAVWIGLFLLRSRETAKRQIGFALIFANVPINRMIVSLLGHNDEQWMARQMYPQSRLAFWIVILVIWTCCLPPLIAAWRAIENRRRTAWFLGFYIVPFAFLPLKGWFFETYLLKQKALLTQSLFGVPYLVLITDLICLLVLILCWRSLAQRPDTQHSPNLTLSSPLP